VHILKKLAVAVLALFSLALLAAAPASAATADSGRQVLTISPAGEMGVADASSCNRPQWGQICIDVNGSGLFVSRVSATHFEPDFTGLICNKEFHVWGHLRSGGEWHRNGVAQCGYTRVWVDFDINDFMADGSQVCADHKDWGVGNWHANGFACIRIHA